MVTRVSLAFFFLVLFSSILMAWLDFSASSTSSLKIESLNALQLSSLADLQLLLLFQQTLSLKEQGQYLQQLQESKIPTDLCEKINKTLSISSEHLQIK
ncbi:MAG: hypothetical protein AABZ60_09535, partial [Planctomycetota bacterium]